MLVDLCLVEEIFFQARITCQFEFDQRFVFCPARNLEVNRAATIVEFLIYVGRGRKPCQFIQDVEVLFTTDWLAIKIENSVAVVVLNDPLQIAYLLHRFVVRVSGNCIKRRVLPRQNQSICERLIDRFVPEEFEVFDDFIVDVLVSRLLAVEKQEWINKQWEVRHYRDVESAVFFHFPKKPASQWLKSAAKGDLVITSKGQPVAVLLRISDASVKSTRALLRSVRALQAQAALQQAAAATGVARLSMSDIDAEIAATRRARRRK